MASLNLNKVILGGRLTADVELKTTPSGVSVCTFSLAVNRKYSKEGEQAADFINCVAWRTTAEFISKYFRKGNSICIMGNIQTRSYTDKDGIKRNVTEVIVDEAMFVDSKSEVATYGGSQGSQGYVPQAYVGNSVEASGFADAPHDDDLPF